MLDAQEKAKLSWRCRRGMLELDLIFQSFLQKGLDTLNEQQVDAFRFLLTSTDPELYAWLMGHEEPHNEELRDIVALIRTYS